MQRVGKKKVLIAPLNWGLGHASRCIPIIQFLVANHYEPILASDGVALGFLKKEFPELKTIELPSYNIRYSKKGFLLKWKLAASFFSIRKAVYKERAIIDHYIKSEEIVGIISDNRFGVYHKEIPTIYITHQIQVLSGFTTFLSTWVHQKMFSKFDVCWIPDTGEKINLAGRLSVVEKINKPFVYIGNLSRLKFEKKTKVYDILILLSGPEPQRTVLENKLLVEFKGYKGQVLLVRGVLEREKKTTVNSNVKIVNYMLTEDLEKAINSSSLVISRSGYSTIMDLAKMKKKAFFIPTPGQCEQEYLAKHLKNEKIAASCCQKDFKLSVLEEIEGYSGFLKEYPLELKAEYLGVFKSQ